MTLVAYEAFALGDSGDTFSPERLALSNPTWTTGPLVAGEDGTLAQGPRFADDGSLSMDFSVGGSLTMFKGSLMGIGTISNTVPLIMNFWVYFTAFNGAGKTLEIGKCKIQNTSVPSIATTSPTLNAGTLNEGEWYNVEIRIALGGGTSEIKINGTTADSTTTAPSTAWINTGKIEWDRGLSGSAGMQFRLASFIANSEDGTGVSGFMGPEAYIARLAPASDQTSDATPATGSDLYAMVDQNEADPAQYNAFSSNGDVASFGAQVDPGSTGVEAVILTSIAHNFDAGDLRDTMFVMGASDTQVGTAMSPATDPVVDLVTEHQVFETNPLTASAWTPADISAFKFGLEQVAP